MLKSLLELIKEMYHSYCQKLDSWCEILDAENEIRKLSNSVFVDSFRFVAKDLSEITEIPYLTYLNEAKKMLMQGIKKQDVMYHYDCIWCELKFGIRSEERSDQSG